MPYIVEFEVISRNLKCGTGARASIYHPSYLLESVFILSALLRRLVLLLRLLRRRHFALLSRSCHRSDSPRSAQANRHQRHELRGCAERCTGLANGMRLQITRVDSVLSQAGDYLGELHERRMMRVEVVAVHERVRPAELRRRVAAL